MRKREESIWRSPLRERVGPIGEPGRVASGAEPYPVGLGSSQGAAQGMSDPAERGALSLQCYGAGPLGT